MEHADNFSSEAMNFEEGVQAGDCTEATVVNADNVHDSVY